jgi:FkbM family methyltransferase
VHRAAAHNEKVFVPFIRTFNFPEAAFRMWIANDDAEKWYDERAWEKCAEFRALRWLVDKGDRILEIGSHHGFTGLLLAHFAGQRGFVLGIEAHPLNAMIAQAQLGLNRSVGNLEFIHAAGSNAPGNVRITTWHNSNVTSEASESTMEVAAVTGDMLAKEHGPFNTIKIDVEGYETETLEGCRKILAHTPKLALEIHMTGLRERGRSISDVLKLIGAHRYEGEMVVRPDYDTLLPFEPSRIPEDGIANVFMKPVPQDAPSPG